MNTEKTENKLKQLFGELREQDSQRVPSFNAVTHASNSIAPASWLVLPWLRVAAGTATVVLLITGIALVTSYLQKRSSEREMQQWAMLSNWEAPTDPLLSILDTPWGGTITTPSDFLIDRITTNSSDTTTKNQ